MLWLNPEQHRISNIAIKEAKLEHEEAGELWYVLRAWFALTPFTVCVCLVFIRAISRKSEAANPSSASGLDSAISLDSEFGCIYCITVIIRCGALRRFGCLFAYSDDFVLWGLAFGRLSAGR